MNALFKQVSGIWAIHPVGQKSSPEMRSLCFSRALKPTTERSKTLEFIANDDDNFDKFMESVEDDEALNFDDQDEEQPDCDNEPVPEPDFDFYDFCNMRHRCQIPMQHRHRGMVCPVFCASEELV
jgi:hypothetical protein